MDFIFQIDQTILLWIQEFVRQDWMDGFWTTITHLGDAGIFWILMSIALLIPKKTRWVGFAGLLALLIGFLIANVGLKPAVARIRPYEVIPGLQLMIEKQSDFSFPSGHTCSSFAAALVYYKMLPKRFGIPAVVLAVIIALSRLYVGVHYPSDVLVGVMVGVFAAFLSCFVVRKLQEKYGNESRK